jgi:hypothetical protein
LLASSAIAQGVIVRDGATRVYHSDAKCVRIKTAKVKAITMAQAQAAGLKAHKCTPAKGAK